MSLLDRLQYRHQQKIQGEKRESPQTEVNQDFMVIYTLLIFPPKPNLYDFMGAVLAKVCEE